MSRKIIEDIHEVKIMCKANFNGELELAFLPYSGGFYEQPAHEIDKISTILRYLNEAIREERKKDKNRR